MPPLLLSISLTLGALWIAEVHVSGGAHSSVELPRGGERSLPFRYFTATLYNFTLVLRVDPSLNRRIKTKSL